jgi:hypothetical protein
MHVHQRKARPTVTILKNTSSSKIVINRLEREREGGKRKKHRDERKDFSFICA